MCKVIFEHILHYMMVPGKVENWVVIIDLIDLGLATMPYSVIYRINVLDIKRNDIYVTG